MIYLLSCVKIENGGGVYAYELTKDGKAQIKGCFPCNEPMYAVKTEKGLCTLLRKPWQSSEHSGYCFIDEKLRSSTTIVDTQGVVACHLCVDEETNDVFVVNYLSGNIVKNGETVCLREGNSVHPTRQTSPHTHFVHETPDGYLLVCDLGTDALAVCDKNLQAVSYAGVPSGYGIRHCVFSLDGKFIYAVNELIPSVSVFAYEKGKATLLQTISMPCQEDKASGAAIRLSKDGKTLYVSVRVENAIFVYDVDGEKLSLRQKRGCGGNGPRDFNLCDDFLVCTNELSGNVTIFRLEEDGDIGICTDELSMSGALCCVNA